MKRVTVDDLPADPLSASSVFHQHWLPHIVSLLEGREHLVVVLAPAGHDHREWRNAIAAGLARAHAPQRVNLVGGEGRAADEVEKYLAGAPGVTGQYLECASRGLETAGGSGS